MTAGMQQRSLTIKERPNAREGLFRRRAILRETFSREVRLMVQSRATWSILLAILVFVVFAAASRSGLAADPFVIQVLAPETGTAAFLGKEEAQALEVLEKDTNNAGGIDGRQIRFNIQDDQSNPQTAVQ